QWYSTATTSEKWMYTSYERDGESGNDYALARSYENRLGRFTATDPLAAGAGNPQSLNRYSYVGNDPIDGADPSGMVLILNLYGGFGGGGGFGSDWNEFDAMNIKFIAPYRYVDGIPIDAEVGTGLALMGGQTGNPLAGIVGSASQPQKPPCLAGVGPLAPGQSYCAPQTLVNCNTVLPNGQTVGYVVQQEVAALQDAKGIGTGIDTLPDIRIYLAFAYVASPGGPIDFKNNFNGQAAPNLLGQAGNFAYYAIGSAYFPTFALDAGATGYAILAHGSLSSPNAQVVRSNGLAANGCK
ncbi:MAG: RHS repeat-associated core domain-containing protein, partial [Candidatus Acidiferrales bacterium]